MKGMAIKLTVRIEIDETVAAEKGVSVEEVMKGIWLLEHDVIDGFELTTDIDGIDRTTDFLLESGVILSRELVQADDAPYPDPLEMTCEEYYHYRLEESRRGLMALLEKVEVPFGDNLSDALLDAIRKVERLQEEAKEM